MSISKVTRTLLKRQLLECKSLGQKSLKPYGTLQNTSVELQNEDPKLISEHADLFRRIQWGKVTDPSSRSHLEENMKRRQVKVDLNKILNLYNQVTQEQQSIDVLKELMEEVLKFPNDTHGKSWLASDTDMTKNVIHSQGSPGVGEVPDFMSFCKNKNLIRMDNLGNLAGHRAYFTKGPLAELEQALIRFTVHELRKQGFEVISVPDILYPGIIDSCGFPTRSNRSQVFFLDGSPESCLAGTAEMSIAGFFRNKVLSLDELPLKIAAVSRCYRAETSSTDEEAGLYRVHYFTKVEMFGITAAESGAESNELHEEFLKTEQSLFDLCNLHYRVLEMPPSELGLSAHRKFDIEAWLPGKKFYGEISSCSNCTDFQSRRLNIRYNASPARLQYVHTVNGTACAIPRMLISLVENFQTATGLVDLPPAIQSHMVRSWSESDSQNPKVEFNFLRTKSQQDRVTSEYL